MKNKRNGIAVSLRAWRCKIVPPKKGNKAYRRKPRTNASVV